MSQGIIIRHERDRLILELFNFFYDTLGMQKDNGLSKNFFGFLIIHMYGTKIPYNHHFSSEVNYIIQKEYFNKIKKYRLLDYIDTLGINALKIYRDSKINTNWYDKNKKKDINKYSTLHQLYMTEISGAIDFYKNDIEETFRKVIDRVAISQNIVFEKNDKKIDSQLISNIIYNIFDQKKIEQYLPSIDIGAMLHAKLRWNKTQKYKQGDFDDIRHATMALPYYDFLFTERSLRNMIHECKYDKKYNCKVMSNNEDIIEVLESLVEKKL